MGWSPIVTKIEDDAQNSNFLAVLSIFVIEKLLGYAAQQPAGLLNNFDITIWGVTMNLKLSPIIEILGNCASFLLPKQIQLGYMNVSEEV